jgi:Fuc2NAc and GlcNAc transferase
MAVVGYAAWFATGFVRKHALRHAMLDIPNVRSSHSSPVARGGGLAIALVFLSCVCILATQNVLASRTVVALIGGGGLVAMIGYIDDRGSVPARIRLMVHILAAVIAVVALGGVSAETLSEWGIQNAWIGSLIGVLVLSWATNLFNFMDGIDGIAGSQAVFMLGAGSWFNWDHGGNEGLTIAMAGLAVSTLGFLIWNLPPARIFMGDVGSGFLGFSIAVFSLATSQQGAVPFECWIILSGVFLVDASVTLTRRVFRGDRWYEAHRSHAYQNLARRWKAHLPVTLSVLAVNVFWLLPIAKLVADVSTHRLLYLLAALIPIFVLALLTGAGKEGNL